MAITKTDVYDVQAPFALDLRLFKADLNARNAIGTFQRYLGMVVCVLNDYTFWQLQGGTTNDDWVQVFLPDDTGVQSVVVNAGAPTGGNDGDIWFRQVGSTVTVYQRVSGTWTALGAIETGGATYTLDPSTPSTNALSYLNTNYPSAKPGDQVYKTSGGMRRTWTCYATGAWSRIDEVIET